MNKQFYSRILLWVCALIALPMGVFADSSSSSSESSESYSAQPLTIVRDSYGVPTIYGGTFPEICFAIGQVYGEDRLWQLFEANVIANGNAAAYFGPGMNYEFYDSDVFQRDINPTDTEVQNQINLYFTEATKTVYENFVNGLNAYIAVVNADPANNLPFELAALGFDPPTVPVPNFSLYDILRLARYVFQGFSPSQNPMYQLSNLYALDTFTVEFGPESALQIFNDLDPTTAMIKSQNTMVQNHWCCKKTPSELALAKTNVQRAPFKNSDPAYQQKVDMAKKVSQRLRKIKEHNKKYAPSLGSNGQAISPRKSQTGNALLRMAPQPGFNMPSDFYEIRIENSVFTGDYFSIPGLPFGIGAYNHFGLSAQVGQLPTNDYLYESIDNVVSATPEIVEVRGVGPIPIIVYRSSSNGWVVEYDGASGIMLTLRSAFFDRQLEGLNIEGVLPFIRSVKDFVERGLKIGVVSDIVGFQGQVADSNGDIGAYQATAWTELPPEYDRRLPQGIPQNPMAPNSAYEAGIRPPQHDVNGAQGFYNGWNSLFRQFDPGSGDTLGGGGPGLNRSYWLYNYLQNTDKISFDGLKYLTVIEAVANSITAFNSSLNEYADLFTPLFKKRFIRAIENLDDPTPDQLRAIKMLKSYQGQWFSGSELNIISTTDVSDRFILASTWLLCFASKVLNPYVAGTVYEVGQSTPLDPLPTMNPENVYNSLLSQGNLLARILGTNYDNTVFYDGWLNGIPDIDAVIVSSLNEALTNLGGFAAYPWGKNKRPIFAFSNGVLGDLIFMQSFNASGLYMVLEFSKKGIIRSEGVIPLGESGQILVGPGFNPIFNLHDFDQQYLFVTFQLRQLPTFTKHQ